MDLPSPLCDSVQVPAGNTLALRVYALGVPGLQMEWHQLGVCRASGDVVCQRSLSRVKSASTTPVPPGRVIAAAKWFAARVPGTGCTPDSSAIPWLKLQMVTTEGAGIFSSVTFIQRVNTTGGTAPTAPGIDRRSEGGALHSQYYFYRAAE